MDWYSYLKNVTYHPMSDELERYSNILTKLRDPYLGDLRTKDTNKILFCEKTKKFPGCEKYHKYTFYFLSLITLCRSRAIKEDDLYRYGITKEIANTAEGVFIFNNGEYVINGYKLPISSKLKEENEDLICKYNDLFINEIKKIQNLPRLEWFSKYQEYLSSEEWMYKRQLRLIEDNNACVGCGSKENLHIHHLSYENVGNENLNELVTLCKSCHKEAHKN